MAPSITDAEQRLAEWYSATHLGTWGTRLLALVQDHLGRKMGRDGSVLNWGEPLENIAAARKWLDDGPHCAMPHEALDRLDQLVRTMLGHGQNLHHPYYLGHQVPASLPLASLFDFLGSVTNQVMAIYEMGPWSTAVEHAMVEHLGGIIGYESGSFAGLCTHGGSLANLTALLTARNVCVESAWTAGVMASQRAPVLVVQNDVHYSVTRSAGVLGIGTQQVIRIPVDSQRKMRVDLLDDKLAELRRLGHPIVAVVSGACATPIGAFDPLDEVADICHSHGVWLHVDAAHGGAVLLSEQHRHLLRGIERADSLVWDAHKMMFMPALCAFVFYRNKGVQFEAFRQDAPYLFDPSNPGIAEYDSGTRTAECTKRAVTFPVWAIWSLLGPQFFCDAVDVVFARTRQFYEKLRASHDFVPVHEPECNIQVFRYQPIEMRTWPADRIGEFQLALRRRVITSGDAYLVPIRLEGIGALRATIINPLTSDSDLNAVLDIIRNHGAELLKTQ